jgi:hypothetical protein
MTVIFLVSKSNNSRFKLFSDVIKNDNKLVLIDIFENFESGLTEESILLQTKRRFPKSSLCFNFLTEIDLKKAIQNLAKEDQDFAYSQWLAYIPSLINSSGSRILNKPSLNQINAISLNAQLNRLMFLQKNINIPQEVFISNLQSLIHAEFHSENIVYQNEAGLFRGKISKLDKSDFPLKIFNSSTLPSSYFFMAGILYSKNLSKIHKSSSLYKVIRDTFKKMNVSFGICYITQENDDFMIWNILPIMPIEVLKNRKVLEHIIKKICKTKR